MADFKVGDRVRVRKGLRKRHYGNHEIPHGIGVVLKLDTTDGTVEVRYDRKDCWFLSDELELVATAEPAEPATAAPDPRDAEIERLKARVAELESRQSDADRAYYRKLVVACLRRSWSGVISIADAVFAEVKRREGGGDSTSERPLQENCKKNFLVRGKNLLGG